MREHKARLIFMLVLAGIPALAVRPTASGGDNSTRADVLVGWLNTVSFDDASNGLNGSRYFVTDEADGATEVFLPPDLIWSARGLSGTMPHRVGLRGEWIESGGRKGLRVSSYKQLEDARADGRGTGKAAASASTKSGPQPWLVILCKFPDVSAEPKSIGYYQNLFGSNFPGLDHFWREVSYGAINLANSRVAGWYVLPHPRSYYVYGNPLWLDTVRALRDATAAADRDVYFPSYAGITMVFNDFVGEHYSAYGGPVAWVLDGVSRTWGMMWMPPVTLHNVYGHDRDANHHVFAHEMGHAMGLPHSTGSYGDTYDNLWDVMSHWGSRITDPVYGLQAVHTNAYHKDFLGWIPSGQKYVAAAGTEQTIRLSRLALPLGAGYKIAQIRLPGAHERYYTAEARQRAGYDTGLYGDAVTLYEVDPDRYSPTQWETAPEWKPCEIIDTDGNGFTGDDGAMQLPGEVFSDPLNGVSIGVESASDSGFTITINNNAKFLPHMANGSGTSSTLLLMNPSSSDEVAGSVKSFAGNGDPLRVTIDGVAGNGSFEFRLPPRGVGYFVTDGQGDLQTGSMTVTSNSPVVASLMLSGQTGTAAVPAVSLSATSLIVPVEFDPSRGVRGGAALSNPNSDAILVECSLRDESAVPPAGMSRSVTIPARGQALLFPDEMFPSLAARTFRGTLVVSSSVPFDGIGILQAGAGQFTTIPSGPVDRVSKAKPVGIVSTFAGAANVRGANDGDLQAARFASPNDIAADGAGNLYVADTSNHVIRKITPQGLVSTIAGTSGVTGSQDGIGAAARFSYPRGICSSEDGTLFIVDYGNHIIRKLTPDGAVTTIAGLAGVPGGTDGPAGQARFNYPRGIAFDVSGNIYVSDTSNHAIRRITPDGIVATIAGIVGAAGYADGRGADARFDGPQKITLDSAGNLLVADYENCVIRKVTPDGVVTTVSGTAGLHGGMDGSPDRALFGYPLGMAVDAADNLYVTDGWTVRRVAKDGSVATLAGSPKINTTPNTSLSGSRDGVGSDARFAVPAGLTIHPSGDIFIADRDNHLIRKMEVNALPEATYFSQFADGDGLASTFVLVNPSLTEPCTGIVELRDSQGRPLEVSINGARVAGIYPFSLAAGGSIWLQTDGNGPLMTGSVRIASDIPVHGSLIFSGYLGLGGTAPVRPSRQLTIPLEIDERQSLQTAIAISNPNSGPVSLVLRLRDSKGALIAGGEVDMALPPLGQAARFPAEFLTGKPVNLAQFQGTLEIIAADRVCAMALRLSPGVLASLPVIQ